MISVVIPLYNKEKSIVTAIDSVLNQTYTDWELIIVDDGSTDHSLSVVQEYVRGLNLPDGKVKILTKPNGGVSSARNMGIMESKSDYVELLDGDDIWHPDFLKEMVRLMEDYPGKSIYGIRCYPIYKNRMPDVHNETYYRGETRWDWETMAFSGSSSCLNKSDAIAVGLFDTRITHGEDVDMWWRMLLKNGGACYLKPYSFYRQDAENRASHREMPLESYFPTYMDKFEEARKSNAEFRRFFDREIVLYLYPYRLSKRYHADARKIMVKLDYSQLKFSMWFRMMFPHSYKWLTKIFLNR